MLHQLKKNLNYEKKKLEPSHIGRNSFILPPHGTRIEAKDKNTFSTIHTLQTCNEAKMYTYCTIEKLIQHTNLTHTENDA